MAFVPMLDVQGVPKSGKMTICSTTCWFSMLVAWLMTMTKVDGHVQIGRYGIGANETT